VLGKNIHIACSLQPAIGDVVAMLNATTAQDIDSRSPATLAVYHYTGSEALPTAAELASAGTLLPFAGQVGKDRIQISYAPATNNPTSQPTNVPTPAPTGGNVYKGFIVWTQACSSQSDAQQDAIMNNACASTFPGSKAASYSQISTPGVITGRPGSNTSGEHLIGTLNDPSDLAHRGNSAGCVSGYARNCIDPSASLTSISYNPNCQGSGRSALCIG